MDVNKMRNIVVLKNLPSNIVEEAFVILKKNQKIAKLEHIDKTPEQFKEKAERENEDEYVVKEAELLISNYIDDLENKKSENNYLNNELIGKYKRLKFATIILGSILTICIGISLFS